MRADRTGVVLGVVVWLLMGVVAAVTGRGTLVEVLLAFAVLVLVPLGLPWATGRSRTAGPAVAAGAPVAVALLLGRGLAATLLAVPWVMVAAGFALRALVAWWGGSRRLVDLSPVVALGYLTVGALWLVADRAALEPVGFAPPFVALTAVHFHHAGFVATSVLAQGLRPGVRAPGVATLLVVGAPPVVALGFVAVPALLVVGAVLLTAGLWTFAVLVWRRPEPGRAGSLLRVSGAAVLLPMVLAVHWATGAATGWFQPLNVGTMAATHGVLQALGFGLFGLLGRQAGADLT